MASNFAELWSNALENKKDSRFLAVGAAEGAQLLNYKFDSFYRRMSRIAVALSLQLKLKAGTPVILLTEAPNEFSLCLHAALVSNYSAVPLGLDLNDDTLAAVINNIGAKAVAFSIESAARIAGLFGRLPTVEHWILAGTSSRAGLGQAVVNLDELAAQVSGDDLDLGQLRQESQEGQIGGLVVMTRGTRRQPRGAEFTQAALIAATENLLKCLHLESAAEEVRISSMLPMKSLVSITTNHLAPLVAAHNVGTGIQTLAGVEFDPRDAIDFVQSNNLSRVVIDQQQARLVVQRAKPRNFDGQDKFSFLVVPNCALNSKLIEDLKETFKVGVSVAYAQTECGGIVSARPFLEERLNEGLYTGLVPSGEIISAGTKNRSTTGSVVQIVSEHGQIVAPGEIGEIQVSSAALMRSYKGTPPGDTFLAGDGVLNTGDRGMLVEVSQDKSLFYVVGNSADFVQRAGQEVNLSWIESALYELRGVQFARVVGFESKSVGTEIGVYLVVNRVANITESTVSAHLLARLPWAYIPKVVLFGMSVDLSNDEILGRFKTFANKAFKQ